MQQKIRQQFQEKYQQEPLVVRAPGRFNLIGEHTDYNLGFVMPGAIVRSMWFAIARSDDPQTFDMTALDVGESAQFSKNLTVESGHVTWRNYVQSVLLVLQEAGHPVQGFRCFFGGNIPMGAGLSSSAALCCGLIFAISELQNLDLERTEMALLAQAAEHRIGLNCGLMDQYAVLFGKAGHLLCLDCKSLEFNLLPLPAEGHAFVLINSNIKHALAAGSGYNERRASCERVAAAVKKRHPAVASLRDITVAMLGPYRGELHPVDFRRAEYVLEENARVLAMGEALRANDLATAGELLFQAHQGMRSKYEITVPEIDLLVDLAKAETSVLGARMVGGGFGGCTLNLMENEGKEAAIERITAGYFEQTGIRPGVFEVRAGSGVEVMGD